MEDWQHSHYYAASWLPSCLSHSGTSPVTRIRQVGMMLWLYTYIHGLNLHPGMALAIVACMLRCFECAWTYGYKEYREKVLSRRRIWKSLSNKPLGPINGKVVQLPHSEKSKEPRSEVHLYECPICWEPGSRLLALPCLHILCSRSVLIQFHPIPRQAPRLTCTHK